MFVLETSVDDEAVDGVEEKEMDKLMEQTDDEYISGTLNEILKMD